MSAEHDDTIDALHKELYELEQKLAECQCERDKWEQACTLARIDHNAFVGMLVAERDRLRAAIEDVLRNWDLFPELEATLQEALAEVKP